MKIAVTDIQRFCMHDGPGIRTVVFLKGCPLHCLWCHNPETQSPMREVFFTDSLCMRCGACVSLCGNEVHILTNDSHSLIRDNCTVCGKCAEICPAGALEISGRLIDAAEVIDLALRDLPFYSKNGGITISGGEPLAQGEGTMELIRLAKAKSLDVAIETSGFFAKKYCDIVSSCDHILFDVKDTCPLRLKQNTGADFDTITKNLFKIDSITNGTIRLRCIMIPGVNMNIDHYRALAEIERNLKHCEGIELIPYHAMGLSKSTRLGRSDISFKLPTDQELSYAAESVRCAGGNVIERRKL